MAKNQQHVWGIEIGQSALKALRCHLDGDEVVADTFDYIEYPKILSQPDSEPEKLVADALQQFISRNQLKNCRVAISVPGQNGLSKFFKPPPVEVKKIPDIVRYEAKQQIPFDLNDVVWDFQQMAGSQVSEGYALESEVGLFAMKREAVLRALKPFKELSIDIDLLQLAPMSVYSMLAYDRYSERLANETFDPDHPPKSIVLLSMGTDSTDLIITNGFRVWQRNMPLGGNHFTRQLTKDLKLTFAKAEHLKRNAMQADDPKLIFQAMRPIFNDLVTEIQRSIGFFKSLNKKSEIDSILLLGNTVKLPGLQPFLNKNLGFEVSSFDRFQRLAGSEVTGAPAFKENQLAFGVVYGLCLQMLGQGPLTTNLVPRDIVLERIVRAKKPWAVAALAALLLGFLSSFIFLQKSANNVAKKRWEAAEKHATDTEAESKKQISTDNEKKGTMELLNKIGYEVSSNADRRVLWLELLSAIQGGLNRDPSVPIPSPMDVPYNTRPDFHFTRIDSRFVEDVAPWLTDEVKAIYAKQWKARVVNLGLPEKDLPDEEFQKIFTENPITGRGWIIEIDGYHYYNGRPGEEKEEHVYANLLHYLETGSVELPDLDGRPTKFKIRELGIRFPLTGRGQFDPNFKVPNPIYETEKSVNGTGNSGSSKFGKGGGMGMGMGMGGGLEGGSDAGNGGGAKDDDGTLKKDEKGNILPRLFDAPKYSFTVQFIWQETPLSIRLQKRQEEQKKAADAAGQGVASNP